MSRILPTIESPVDLKKLTLAQLEQLAREMRESLCNLVGDRPAHFASNLGVVELTLALHTSFDFRRDRLIWDTGHQIYPHKMITGRFHEFKTIRTKGGLMGYPNPNESEYDLFMTGHAGCSISTMLGLRVGDDLQNEPDRHAVAVIGDGAFPSGIVYEALNNAGGLKKNLIVIINDNKMSICPRVGGLAEYLDRLRVNPVYTGMKNEVVRILNHVPILGDPFEKFLWQVKESVKAGLHGGMLFEELGLRYLGPIDGHNIGQMKKYLNLVKGLSGPVLLHVVTEKGHGFRPAAEDPVFFHTPPQFTRDAQGEIISIKKSASKAYTDVAALAVEQQLEKNPKACVLTAAMCQGNRLETVRDRFPNRFFDVGICESHAVAFAAGMAKTGMRPIVAIYSTFMQRSYDQIFQEVALQNLPVLMLLDRGGLTGPDGPTHHGCFDVGYMRVFPNVVVAAPGDEPDLAALIDFAMQHPGPVSLRYPKAAAEAVCREVAPVALGQSEVLNWGSDGMILCCGTLLATCAKAAEKLREEGLNVGVINARFIKPLDNETTLKAIRESRFVITVEEAALMGGYGSAVLEAAATAGVDASRVTRLGIPDRFIEHGERADLLADLGLNEDGIMQACRRASRETERPLLAKRRQVS